MNECGTIIIIIIIISHCGIQTQSFNIYNMKEVLIQSQRYLCFRLADKRAERKQGPQKVERWQGPPHINSPFKVSLFIQS